MAGGREAVVSYQGWVLHVPIQAWAALPRPPGAPDEAAAWAGDHLLVWGGVSWEDTEATILEEGWIWTPPWSDPMCATMSVALEETRRVCRPCSRASPRGRAND
jgi:hypothetical protein